MTLHITNDAITSDETRHTARLLPLGRGVWEVSWLPGRLLDRNTAIRAMTLAEVLTQIVMYGGLHPDDQRWSSIQAFASELALSVQAALACIFDPDTRHP